MELYKPLSIIIINCFETYEHRVKLIKNYFSKRGDSVKIIQSNFCHFEKMLYNNEETKKKETDNIFINIRPYYRNISISRLLSHVEFSKKSMEMVGKYNPDLLYIILPPNSLAKEAINYIRKQNNNMNSVLNVKLIFDLLDLWPETLPIKIIKNIWPLSIWKKYRDNNLCIADYIITECDLYQKIINKKYNSYKMKTIYLAREKSKWNNNSILSEEKIELCYLGSINNIIDIKIICKIISYLIKIIKLPVIFHIIGNGEKRKQLVNDSVKAGSRVVYHGNIYENEKKQIIFDKCHYGLNIMKKNVCVGLTMKSIDYFEAGLPLINNIKGDTEKIIDEYKIGINITNPKDIDGSLKHIDREGFFKICKKRNETREVFNKLFTRDNFENSFDLVVNEVLTKNEL